MRGDWNMEAVVKHSNENKIMIDPKQKSKFKFDIMGWTF